MNSGDTMSENHDCGGDAAAYVLGALSEAEADAFTSHMEQCVVCRDEVAALTPIAGAVAMAAPQYRAPRHLRRQVMKAVYDEPRDQAVLARSRPPEPRLGWLTLRPAVAAGFAVVLAAVALGAVLLSSGGGPHTTVFRASLGQAEVRVVGGHSELIVNRLPSPPPGDIYEVWLKRDGRPPAPTNLLFSVTASGRSTVGLPEDLRGVGSILVTTEPAGGSPVPTTAPVIINPLTKRA
jgi:anti-sigma-K factor RskA